MQSHLLVGPISVARFGGAVGSSPFHSAWTSPPRRRSPLVVASSSPAAVNGGRNHYAVLGVARTATAVDIKRAYRLLARKYHPDVSKDPHAAELFKSIHHAYEVLSNEATRVQYDQELQFGHKPYREKWSYSTEFEDQVRVYRWAHVRKKMDSERYWEHYNANEGYYSSDETDEEEDERNLDEERSSFIEVLRSAFMSLFLVQTFGSRLSLTFSGLMALFDKKLDTGYKIGYAIAWILGGRGGILLTLCLSFASWVCGKTSSSVVALVVVAMWVGSYLARYAPLPQGALLALLYMSIKLQSDLI
ncbi:dnaJ, partial [Mucuna pruriens]